MFCLAPRLGHRDYQGRIRRNCGRLWGSGTSGSFLSPKRFVFLAIGCICTCLCTCYLINFPSLLSLPSPNLRLCLVWFACFFYSQECRSPLFVFLLPKQLAPKLFFEVQFFLWCRVLQWRPPATGPWPSSSTPPPLWGRHRFLRPRTSAPRSCGPYRTSCSGAPPCQCRKLRADRTTWCSRSS